MSVSVAVCDQFQGTAASTLITLDPVGVNVGDLMAVVLMAPTVGQLVGPAVNQLPDGWVVTASGGGYSTLMNDAVILTKVADATDVGASFTFGFTAPFDLTATFAAFRSSLSGHVASVWVAETGINYAFMSVTGTAAQGLAVFGQATEAPHGTFTDSAGHGYTLLAQQGLGTDSANLLQSACDFTATGGSTGTFTPPFPTSHSGATGIGSMAGILVTEVVGTPLAPTNFNPTPGQYVDATNTLAFEATYNPINGHPSEAYAFKIIAAGGGTYYWDVATESLQTSIVWNTWDAAPGDPLIAIIPPGTTDGPVNGSSFSYSFASQEAGGGAEGPFSAPTAFSCAAVPSVDVTAPVGNQTTSQPTVVWTVTLAPGASAVSTDVQILTYPDTVLSYDSGLLSGSSGSFQITSPIGDGDYYPYLVVTDSNGQQGQSAAGTFTVTIEEPAPPTLIATPTNDSTTGAPQIDITATGNDNLLSNDDAGFNASVGSWTGTGTGTSLARSSAVTPLSGLYCAVVDKTSTGAWTVATAKYAFSSAKASGTIGLYAGVFTGTATVTINWYNSSGASVGSPSTQAVSMGAGVWNVVNVNPSSIPAGAAQFSLEVSATATATGAQLYMDQAGLFELTTAPTWTAGGFVGNTTIEVQSSTDNVNFSDVYGMSALPVPSPGQVVTAIDRTPAVGSTVYYRARTVGTIGSAAYDSAWTSIGAVEMTPSPLWWLQIPGDPDSAVGFNLSGDPQLKPKEVGTVNYPLGDPTPTKVTDGYKGFGGVLPIRVVSVTALNQLRAMLEQTGTLLLSTPMGNAFYVQHDPQTDPVESITFQTAALGANAYANITFNFIAAPAPTS